MSVLGSHARNRVSPSIRSIIIGYSSPRKTLIPHNCVVTCRGARKAPLPPQPLWLVHLPRIIEEVRLLQGPLADANELPWFPQPDCRNHVNDGAPSMAI